MTDADRALVLTPASQAARAQLLPFLPMIGPQLDRLRDRAPSYMVDAIQGVTNALAQWERDEQDAKFQQRVQP
jgi:hypothetical protein